LTGNETRLTSHVWKLAHGKLNRKWLRTVTLGVSM